MLVRQGLRGSLYSSVLTVFIDASLVRCKRHYLTRLSATFRELLEPRILDVQDKIEPLAKHLINDIEPGGIEKIIQVGIKLILARLQK